MTRPPCTKRGAYKQGKLEFPTTPKTNQGVEQLKVHCTGKASGKGEGQVVLEQAETEDGTWERLVEIRTGTVEAHFSCPGALIHTNTPKLAAQTQVKAGRDFLRRV